MAKSSPRTTTLQAAVLRLSRVSFYFVGLFMGVIIISDAWNLITRESVIERWTLAASILVVTASIWFLAKMNGKSPLFYKVLAGFLVGLYILTTTITVYSQRGIASRGVFLYSLPLVMSAVLASRAAIFVTATFSVAAYSLVSIRYFYLNYGEAYKVELYGELIFYCGVIFVLAGLMWVAVRAQYNR